jgi:DNA-binding CsgD family transcriptional regulator
VLVAREVDGGAPEEQGIGAILLTSDAAAGQAIAFACARRGLVVTVAEVGQVEADGSEVLIFDLRAEGGASVEELARAADLSGRRMIAIGELPEEGVARHLATRLGLDADIGQLIAAVSGSDRSSPTPVAITAPEPDLLTAREHQVIRLLLTGLGAEGIAAHLGIAPNTVRTHLQNILSKLDVSSRAEAAAWALGAGLEPAHLSGEAVR